MTDSDLEGVRAGLFAGSSVGAGVPLLGVDVCAEVRAGHARVVVRQRYRNEEARPIEGIYTFPLPSRAVITGFAMTVNDRRLVGEVREREAAFKQYDDAISTGHGAALLDQERGDVFTASIGNLLPLEETVIEIEYVERLFADQGAIRWSIPTLVAPRYVPAGVLDEERISPPIGDVAYGLALDLVFDLGLGLEVASPSHAVVARMEGKQTRVTFTQDTVALDRDVVITATPTSLDSAVPIASAIAHKRNDEPGAFALTVVPDLGCAKAKGRVPRDVVFVLDRSGSMGGEAMSEARTALRLCIRQLEEGDRFNVLAFDDQIESFAPTMVPLTSATLQRVDTWIQHVDARGGTELLEPLVEAARLAPDGIIVLLTDGQVANEDEIVRVFMDARRSARVYTFGIGTNVSDALLHTLAARSGGALESIYPGERVDEKVVAQFARATARRVTDLVVKLRNVELFDMAPAEPAALVDGEPFTIFGRFEHAFIGAIEIRGKLDGEAFYYEMPIDLTEASEQPFVLKLWAQARIRDLERAPISGRRADGMKARIVNLAVEHGVSSRYTSFVVVETRMGDRRRSGQPESRIIGVDRPAGWLMFGDHDVHAMTRCGTVSLQDVAACRRTTQARDVDAYACRTQAGILYEPTMVEDELDPVQEKLARQSASGLWDDGEPVKATVEALVFFSKERIDGAHAIYGAQIRKAIDALLAHVDASPPESALLELALGIAWLLTSGPRTRRTIETMAKKRGVRVDTIAGAC